jgi:hypothetical protein
MRILTLEAIRCNPWNALSYELPAHPSRLLLELARLAAHYCRQSEYELMLAAREGNYVPWWWCEGAPDAHEESEALALEADEKLTEIFDLLEVEFGEPHPDDESLVRTRK